jgi:methionine-S-sulfoxide reductase
MTALELATFAGGCFWCMQPPFDHHHGVIYTKVGYMGGHVSNPTYESVCIGNTGHSEVIQITYDPTICTYESLLELFWKNIDPTDAGGQFSDRGSQYQSAIFVHSESQQQLAEKSKSLLDASGKFGAPIITPILPATHFFVGENYHQCYYKTNSPHYAAYKKGSGRAEFLKKHWGETN